jgi:hypothetical protein
MLTPETLRIRLGCMRLTGESTRILLISPVSQLPLMFQTVILNNMRSNVAVLLYDDHY